MVRKEQMVNSARLTCDYLGLRQGDKAHLCMPLRYIAGKMMVVRSLVAGLDLVIREPSGHPLADIDMPLRFAAMIPFKYTIRYRFRKNESASANGRLIADNQNTQTAGQRGPIMMQDPWFLEKLAHFDREVSFFFSMVFLFRELIYETNVRIRKFITNR